MSGALLAFVLLAVAGAVAGAAFRSRRGRWLAIGGAALLIGGVAVAIVGSIVAETERDETDALSLGILMVLAGIALSLWAYIRGRSRRS